MREDGVEIVFVSSDRTPADMENYMREVHGDWWAVEHGSEEAQALKQVRVGRGGERAGKGDLLLTFRREFACFDQRFSVSAVPTVVVLRASDGSVITKEGRSAIQRSGPKAAQEWMKD